MSEPLSVAMNQMNDIHVDPDMSALTDLDNMLLAVAEEARLKNAPNPLPNWLRSRSDVHQWQRGMLCMAKARCTRYLAGEQQVVRALRTLLCVAVPGSGKTISTLLWIKTAIMMGWVQRVIIVTPSDNVKKNWAKEAMKFGLDLKHKNTAEILGPLVCGHIGRCTTYQQVARIRDKPDLMTELKDEFRQIPTMLVCDEIHHAGENNTWGGILMDLFADVANVVLLSGTPVRTDGDALPFTFPRLNPDGKNEAVAHATYTYRQGLEDGNLRAMDLHTENGIIKWHSGDKSYEHYLDAPVTKKIRRKRLIKAIDLRSVDEHGGRIGNPYVCKVLFDAGNELQFIRSQYPDAQGLIVCEDREAATIIKETTFPSVTSHLQDGGIIPLISISQKGGPRQEGPINDFRAHPRNYPWIVAVKQISEGVDIPNICVIVYLTNVSTRMFIIQVLGRAMRMSKTPSMKTLNRCCVFMPKDERLVGQCQTLLNDVASYRDSIAQADECDNREGADGVPAMGSSANETGLDDATATGSIDPGGNLTMDASSHDLDEDMQPDVLDAGTRHTQTVQYSTDEDLLHDRVLESEDGTLVPGLARAARTLQSLPGCDGIALEDLMEFVRQRQQVQQPRLPPPVVRQTLTLDDQIATLRGTIQKKVQYLIRVSDRSPRRWTRGNICTQLSWYVHGKRTYKKRKFWTLDQLKAAVDHHIPRLSSKIKAGGKLDMC